MALERYKVLVPGRRYATETVLKLTAEEAAAFGGVPVDEPVAEKAAVPKNKQKQPANKAG